MPSRHFHKENIYQAEIGKARYKKNDTVSNATRVPEFYKNFYLIDVSWSFGRLNDATGEIDYFFEVVRVETTPDDAPKTPAPQPKKLQDVYRLYHPGLQVHLYSSDTNERTVLLSRGWQNHGLAWKSEATDGKPVYRLYNPDIKCHFYTTDANEYKVLGQRGWKQEGVAYRSSGNVPIYRLYHKGLKKHLFTRDQNEYKVLATRGWKQEGVAWYAAQ